MIRFKPLLLTASISSILLLSACNESSNSPVASPAPVENVSIDYSALYTGNANTSQARSITLPKLNNLSIASLGNVTFSSATLAASDTPKTVAFNVGFSSGAFHMPGDENNIFYTVTDRGPNVKCSASEAITGIAELCGPGNGSNKIFPIPDFTPSIYKFKITTTDTGTAVEILETIPLKNTAGEKITGLTNNLTVTNTELSFAADGTQLDFDNEGLDTESLVRLSDGTFWLSEEYAPSLIHVAADGTILERVVPQSVAADLADANYKVSGLLPDVFKFRKLNRGIESVAVSPDETALYFIMQSPLAHPNKDAYKASRHVRLVKFALNSGEIGAQIGEYIYELDTPQTFNNPDDEGDSSSKQTSIKISEMTAVGADDLIVLERNSSVTKLYRIKLDTAANIMGTALSESTVTVNESTEAKTLEQVFDLDGLNASPVSKVLVFNSLTDLPIDTLPSKIEGIALLDDGNVLLTNDNDFGIAGDDTVATILDIGARFTAANTTPKNVSMNIIGRYQSGIFGESAAEIVTYHNASQRIFVVNANDQTVDVLNASGLSSVTVADPIAANNLPLDYSINVAADLPLLALGAANSVAIHGNLLAVAVEANPKQNNGIVAFYTLSANGQASFQKAVNAGALPDNVAFTSDGTRLIIANEGEPNNAVTIDPEGSISIITVTNGIAADTATAISFSDFNIGGARNAELPADVRIFTPGSTVAQDLEPEYIAISDDNTTAFVTLQENNAVAIIDIATASITKIAALGFKDFGANGNEMDASNKDDAINIVKQPGVVGMYQPDAIASYSFNGHNYFITANEGDARDYDGFSEEVRVHDIVLDSAHPQFANNDDDATLGRLKMTTTLGDTDGDGDFDTIYSYGARSFSIWDDEGRQVFDSNSEIAKITAGRLGLNFNGSDKRSDDKGAEPEAVTVGEINGRLYTFIGLERTGGILMYDITSPFAPQFIQYVNNRDFDSVTDATDGDIAPEGLKFISPSHSPTGNPLLIVGNEVSGTTTVYEVK